MLANDEFLLMIGEKILVRSSSLATIVVSFIGMYYLADMDYEEWCEPALTILQYIIFREEKAPQMTNYGTSIVILKMSEHN